MADASAMDDAKGPWSEHAHTPPHLLLDETWYLISATTWQSAPYLQDPVAAREMCSVIEREYARFGWNMELYVVMPDHYHLVAFSKRGRDLGAIARRIHGAMSAFIRERLRDGLAATGGAGAVPDQPMPKRYFNNYWDTCLNSEKEWLSALEYVRTNPERARLVDNAEDWEFQGPKRPSAS